MALCGRRVPAISLSAATFEDQLHHEIKTHGAVVVTGLPIDSKETRCGKGGCHLSPYVPFDTYPPEHRECALRLRKNPALRYIFSLLYECTVEALSPDIRLQFCSTSSETPFISHRSDCMVQPAVQYHSILYVDSQPAAGVCIEQPMDLRAYAKILEAATPQPVLAHAPIRSLNNEPVRNVAQSIRIPDDVQPDKRQLVLKWFKDRAVKVDCPANSALLYDARLMISATDTSTPHTAQCVTWLPRKWMSFRREKEMCSLFSL